MRTWTPWSPRLLEEQPVGVGYLLKDRVTDGVLLVDAVQRVVARETVLDPTVVATLMADAALPTPWRVSVPASGKSWP